jgi:hypothetical protein
VAAASAEEAAATGGGDPRRAVGTHHPLRGGEEAGGAQVHQPRRDPAAKASSVRGLRHGSFLLASLPPLSDAASFLFLLRRQ